MPTYDYACKKCDYRFERFQKMTDKPLEECPKCAGRVKRLISTGAGIIFKGKGFYQTDYKNKSTKSKGSPNNEKKPDKCEKSDSCDGCCKKDG